MFPLHSILAIQDLVPFFGPIGAAVCAVILLIAFSGGFAKGFRRVRWGGLIWLTVSLVFMLVYKFTPVGEIVKSWALIGMVVYALVCVLAVLAVYGLLAFFVRPSMRWVKDTVSHDDSLAEYGLEFEPEYLEYDGENDYAPYGKILQKTGYNPPSFFGRLLGGLTCAINSAMVLFGIIAFAFIMLGTTRLSTGYLGPILTAPLLKALFDLVVNYALDILTLGVIVGIAIKGYEKGFFASLRSLIITGGGIVAVALCFYVPFTQYAYATDGFFYFVAQLVQRSYEAFIAYGAIAAIIARVLAGVVLAIFAILAIVLLNIFLNKCCGWIEKVRLTRMVDGCLSVVLYAIIGVLVCFGIWMVLGCLDYFDIVKFREALGENATLAKGLLGFARHMLDGLLVPVAA